MVVEALLGHWDNVGVNDVDDLTSVEVEVGDESLERVRPGVVLWVGLDEGGTADEATAFLAGNVEAAGRQGADAHCLDVGDAASLNRRTEGGVVADHLFGRFVLGHRDRGLTFGRDVEHTREQNLALGQRHEDLGLFSAAAFDEE